MRYLPIHIDTQSARIVIIGGGPAAEAKLRTLVKTEAELIVVAPQISDEIKIWAAEGTVTWIAAGFTPGHLDGAKLIYAATESDAENASIAKIAKTKHIPVNAADQKQACDFITPAIVDRSPVVISIGTEGTSPSLARAIKTDLETRLPSGLGKLSKAINVLRQTVKANISDLAQRQTFWAEIFGGNDLDMQIRLSDDALRKTVTEKLSNHADQQPGHVALVGAGPGDPDLLTFAARRNLHSADVIVYDRLVSQGVLDFGRREAEYIYVGKIPGGISTPQDQINAILIDKASQGLNVVRLKSGDPLIFGRADEELDALEQAGIGYSIVPGITAAASAAAEIGASLTTRGRNKAIALMTGHDTKGFAEHDWKGLAAPDARAAIYMGVGASRFIQGRLLLHGADKNLPVTIVENASREDQIILSTNLGHLPDDIKANDIKGPAVLLIGYAPRGAVISSTLQQAVNQ